MAHRKNTKRIDPRYFLNETVNRNDDGSVSEGCGEMEPDGPMDISELSPDEAFAAGMAAARDAIDQAMGASDGPTPEGGFSGGGPAAEPAMHEAAIEESYATTGIEPVHDVLWGKEEVQTPHGTVEVVPITDAGQRPSYARPPVSDRAQQAIEQFTKLKDQVKKMAAAGKFDGYSQIYVHPLPNRAGDLMLYTVDGKREHKPLSEF